MENLPKPQFPKVEELPDEMQPWGRKLLRTLTSFTDEVAKRHKRIIAAEVGEAVESGAPTPSHKLKVWIEGAEYYLSLDAV